MKKISGDTRLLICAGSGGVGKTTISAALGVKAAQQGKSVLVLTVDPARRLMDALGIKNSKGDIVRVPNQNYSGELFASMIQPRAVFGRFVIEACSDPALVDKITSNHLYETLTTTLSGSQEFSSLEALHHAVSSGHYDLVILDTPPAQHAKEFLAAPQKFYSLFQESIIKWFVSAHGETDSFLMGLVHRGTQMVFKALESLTGREFIEQLTEFFRTIQDLQGVIRNHSLAIHQMLVSPECRFLLVTSADEAKLLEATDFHQNLKRGGYGLSGFVLNRATPEWLPPLDLTEEGLSEPGRKLVEYHRQLRFYFDRQIRGLKKFESEIESGIPVYRVPELAYQVVGLESLNRLAEELDFS
jgi:anion-transporting  ArsA/GET3 family ATPase